MGIFNAMVAEIKKKAGGNAAAAENRPFEIFLTSPGTGFREKIMVSNDMTIDQVIEKGRKVLGLDQAWIPSSDFNIYFRDDEDTVLKGTVKENNMKPWGPDGTELPLCFEPLGK